jgi:hypothetical protein
MGVDMGNRKSPPLINESLYKQIQRLKEEVVISNLKIKSSLVNTPLIHTLEEKIVQWIHSLTPAQLERPYTTIEVIRLASLTGKYRSLPALQEVAQILRKHGFEHKRSWTTRARNKRYWLHTFNREKND